MLRRARPLLGTYVEITACAEAPEREWEALAEAFEAVAEIHRLMSFHTDESDVTRLNRGAHSAAVEVDAHTHTVLARAQAFSEASSGLFDCTVGAVLVRAGHLPAKQGMRPAEAISWRDVELLPENRVRFRRPLTLDLGGIAKGYAVDHAVAALERHGVTSACVNAGGDLRATGDRDWPVAIRHPESPAECIPLAPLRQGALATTADALRSHPDPFCAGGQVVDPATGRLRRRRLSVSVLAPTCIDADALTKVVWLSAEPPLELLARFGARAIVLGAQAPLRASAAPERRSQIA